jgi:hypothetical protein
MQIVWLYFTTALQSVFYYISKMLPSVKADSITEVIHICNKPAHLLGFFRK